MLGTMLSKIGLPVLLRLIGGALAKVDDPLADQARRSIATLDQAIQSGRVNVEAIDAGNRHIETMAEIENEYDRTIIEQVNESLRAEVGSEDPYVRRMRPTFGYIMALTWGAQMMAVAFTILTNPAEAGSVMSGMASLSAIWTVGLSVLGIYVYKRSEDKKQTPNKNGRFPGRFLDF